jgi:hypothetical protein
MEESSRHLGQPPAADWLLSLSPKCRSAQIVSGFEQKQPPVASGSNAAAQPQVQERRLFVLAGSARSQQTPAEGREITDRLLAIESRASS